MRVEIGDRFGRILTEVVADVDPVAWILNGIGKTAISLPISDEKATEENLRIGNRVYLEMDKGLPAWGGVLDLPRTWGGGVVKTTCYGIEHLMKYRSTGKNDAFYERPAGYVWQELLRREEAQDPLGITMGEIWMGGRPHWPRYHYKSLWYVIDYSLRRMERCDFRFIPYIDNGHILFRAEFYQVAGEDKSGKLSLIEGSNIAADLRMQEQGAVVNQHFAVGEGSTWGVERLVVAARATESIAKYGVRETGTIYPGVSVESTLEMHARNVLDTNNQPRRIFSLAATNNEPAMYKDYGLGDTVGCVLPSFDFGGFDGTVRVLAREYDPDTGSCRLVVEEPQPVEPWVYQVETEVVEE